MGVPFAPLDRGQDGVVVDGVGFVPRAKREDPGVQLDAEIQLVRGAGGVEKGEVSKRGGAGVTRAKHRKKGGAVQCHSICDVFSRARTNARVSATGTRIERR